MSAVDVNKGYLVTGRLSYGCTDLSQAYPHGGTGLGLVGDIYFQPPAGAIRINAEETNSTPAVLYTGGDAVLGVSLDGWDDTVAGGVLSAVFPSYLQGDTRYVIEYPGQPNDTATASASALRTLTFDSATRTITASSGDYVSDGFLTGMTLTVTGTSANDGTYTVSTVATSVLTVAEALADEGPVSSTATLAGITTNRTRHLPGTMLPTLAPVVFTPINQTEHPALILYQASVLLEATAQLHLSAYRYLSVPLLLVGSPDDNGRVAAVGRLADLSL